MHLHRCGFWSRLQVLHVLGMDGIDLRVKTKAEQNIDYLLVGWEDGWRNKLNGGINLCPLQSIIIVKKIMYSSDYLEYIMNFNCNKMMQFIKWNVIYKIEYKRIL